MAPEITCYAWSGGHEVMLRFGPATGPIVVMVMPLFEEGNRTRAFAVAICRALADRGVASVLPDLPGQGESLAPLDTLSLRTISEGLDEATRSDLLHGRALHAVSIRSGALFDRSPSFASRWRLSPQTGAELLRDLSRMRQVASGASSAPPGRRHGAPSHPQDAPAPPVEIAGNLLSVDLLTDMSTADPRKSSLGSPVRTIRLDSDPKHADRHVPGAPLWRRSEPGNDPGLAALLADDIATWIASCAG